MVTKNTTNHKEHDGDFVLSPQRRRGAEARKVIYDSHLRGPLRLRASAVKDRSEAAPLGNFKTKKNMAFCRPSDVKLSTIIFRVVLCEAFVHVAIKNDSVGFNY